MSKLKEDKLPGGLAAGMTLNDIAKKHGISVDMLVAEFKKGIGVEMEHTSDREVAKEITLDHLFEDPKYYTKLIDMEKGMNESSMGEIDILAKESKTFKDFVKAFHKEYSLIELDREAVKWLEGIYNDRTNESVNEGKYYVTYNLGRGRGKDLEKEFDQKTFKTTNKPKVFSSYSDAKKYAEKMEKMFRNSIGGGTAYWVSDEKMNPIKEAKAPYEVYHKSYTSAIEAAREYAEKKGFEIDNDDAFTKIGMGPRKPSEGKTNKFSIQLSKDGKLQRKQLHIQVYGMKNSYELNAYIG